jgi:hypothetical protein
VKRSYPEGIRLRLCISTEPQANARMLRRLRDNPRRLGKGQIMLVGLAPLEPGASRGMEAEFTSSSGDVRASSVYAKKELGDEER